MIFFKCDENATIKFSQATVWL